MTLSDLKKLAQAAIDTLANVRAGKIEQMALLDAQSVELVATHGKRIIAMIAVIEAADAMRKHRFEVDEILDGYVDTYDAARAKLEQQE